MNKTYHILTYGCQMNEHDSEKIAGMLHSIGYEETDKLDADLVLLNTCLIRENAAQKVYGKLGQLKSLKKNHPDMLIGVCGCMMQKEDVRKETIRRCPYVNLVFGTNNIHELPLLIDEAKHKKRAVNIIDSTTEIHEEMPKTRRFNHKALINVTYGCNNFCTYYVVPYTRGREKSRLPKDILCEINQLAKEGYKEVTLLGQNVNSYGKTFEDKYSFANLLEDVCKIEGIEFVRFMTSHPKDLSDDLIDVIAKEEKICKHFHLPVQSGSSKVLKEMNRHYDRERYVGLVKKLRNRIPDISITTDIIVGFPGETEEDFAETISLCELAEYESAFTFLYSIREGTKAAVMENQIPNDVKHERFNRLLEVIYPIQLKKNLECIGKTYKILVDGFSKNDDSCLTGRTEHFRLVHFKADKSLIGTIVNVKVTSAKTFSLEGTIVE